MDQYQSQCKCGAKSRIVADRQIAEVLSLVHEATSQLAADKHAAVIVTVRS